MSIWKKPKKSYYKMVKRHKKELHELSENYNDWDYGYLNDFVFKIIRNMYEYYSAGENVHQSDDSLNKVKDTLKECVEKIKKFEECTSPFTDAEQELLEDIYKYIGKNIMWWWD